MSSIYSSVCVTDTVSISMSVGEENMRWHFEDEKLDKNSIVFPFPQKNVRLLIFRREVWRVVWYMKGFSLKDWIAHFMPIFHFEEFYYLKFATHSQMYDIEEIKTTITNFNILFLYENGSSNDYYDLILQRLNASKSSSLFFLIYNSSNSKHCCNGTKELTRLTLSDKI